MRGDFKVGRIFGVDIYIDWSWLFIFFLVAWSLSTNFILLRPDWGAVQSWFLAIIAALLFFACVLLHELAHALVAKAQGVPVKSITLFLFGGVANIQREPSSPGAEFLVAIAGPITSFIIGVIFLAVAGASTISIDTMTGPATTVVVLSPLSTLMLWLGSVNILLGIFNLVPAFPLDGGRILRSVFWKITGNLRKATRWASAIGQVIAWLLIFAGIMMVFGVYIPFLGVGLINGLWLAFIGWFLYRAAILSYEQLIVKDILHDVSVARVMRSNPTTVPSNITISKLVYDYLMQTGEDAFPVVDNGQLVGMVSVEEVRAIPRDAWETQTVMDVMKPIHELDVATPDEDAAAALEQLMKRDMRQLPVVRDGRLAGVIRLRDIFKWLQLQSDIQVA
jgi:Zn-dependent protease/predicted transcriptional regulator